MVSIRGSLGSRYQQMGMNSGEEGGGDKWVLMNTNKSSFGNSQKYSGGVLVNSGCCNKISQTGWLK